jgi:trigger factor
VSYRVEVEAIKQKVLPAVDDELARVASEFTTVAELRGKIRADLEKRRESQIEGAARRKLLDKLTGVHEFPVPRKLVEAQVNRKLENFLSQLVRQGIDPRQTELDWRKFREELRPEAEKDVRGSLVLEKIAEAEKIEVSDEELDETIREIAQETHESAAALKTRLTRDGGLDTIQFTRRTQKALDVVYKNARMIQNSEPGQALISEAG